MIYSLDQQTDGTPAWDLTLTLDGLSYPVREVTLKEFNALAARRLARDEDVAFVAGLFPAAKPPPEVLEDDDKRTEINFALAAYVEAIIEKKQAAVRVRVRAAVGVK